MLYKKSGTINDRWTSRRQDSSAVADYVFLNVLPYHLPISLLHDDGDETFIIQHIIIIVG